MDTAVFLRGTWKLGLVTLLSLWVMSPSLATEQTPLRAEMDGANRREIDRGTSEVTDANDEKVARPKIGFITSEDAFCYQPDSAVNECFINWRYMYVSADPAYMKKLQIQINGRAVLNMAGFFQTSLSYQASMVSPGGFRVVCGPPSVDDPLLGNAYSYTIRAEDTNGLASANYGTIQCPAFSP